MLITRYQFDSDMTGNLNELLKFGIQASTVKYFLPPYEWYNTKISRWSAECPWLGKGEAERVVVVAAELPRRPSCWPSPWGSGL